MMKYDIGYNVHIIAFGDFLKYELGSKMEETDIDIIYDKLFVNKDYKTRRQLQEYGTEYCRDIKNVVNICEDVILHYGKNIWIKSMYLYIKNILDKSYNKIKDVFIICDVRFENEFEFIKSLDGINILIKSDQRNKLRLESETGKNISCMDTLKTHESEIGLESVSKLIFDCIVYNDDEINNIDEILENCIKIVNLT